MTTIVNLYGGPGAGKSITAASTFALAKSQGLNCELVTEYIKSWAWEGRKPVNYDQFYFFGQQSRREYTLFDKVDLIITDSPVAICGYFASVFGSESQDACFRQMVREYYSMLGKSGVKCLHFFMDRQHAYDPRGRFQTEQEATDMDVHQLIYLGRMGFDVKRLKSNNQASKKILQEVLESWEKTR